jgi:hypothetical protein
MRRKITNETWEQIKTGYAAGVGLREIARKIGIPEGTVLAHAKRHGWTQQIQVATRELSVMQSDAITVPQSLAAILVERRDRTKLGLSKFAAEAAEQAAAHRDKLSIASKVRDVSQVHSTLWPHEQTANNILNVALLTGAYRPRRIIEEKQVEALEVQSPIEPVAAKTEQKTELTCQNRDPAPALEPEPTPAEIAAQARRQKEAQYREMCRNWRHYT